MICSHTVKIWLKRYVLAKREKGTETGEIFPQGQILPEDVNGEEGEVTQHHTFTVESDEEEEEREEQVEGDKVLACLFNHGELKSVFNHDFAFNNTDLVTIARMDREAREEAAELEEQLRESRQQYMYAYNTHLTYREENPIYNSSVEISLLINL